MARFKLMEVTVSWTVLLTLAHFTYLLVGATIVRILEREAESNNRDHFQLEKLHFLANYTCLDGPGLEKFVKLGKCLTIHLGRLERGMVSVFPHKQTVESRAVSLFFISGSLVFVVIPPLLFSYVKGWMFGKGFYFAFITLSTIGFGDYVVGTDPDRQCISLYRSLAGIWIIFALA
ncbi:potassium channel subfamily K member 16-like [Xyrichtys novacula]|uniref:Potassium channel subfamily K member 16-like n=1 Tax=Xyrichtys novacula TaxID=13765 RepID=A0AAV1GKB9_XYRNO|nr:potassium channel subfamily K member 16-like [Xyrichtys novacula]